MLKKPLIGSLHQNPDRPKCRKSKVFDLSRFLKSSFSVTSGSNASTQVLVDSFKNGEQWWINKEFLLSWHQSPDNSKNPELTYQISWNRLSKSKFALILRFLESARSSVQNITLVDEDSLEYKSIWILALQFW